MTLTKLNALRLAIVPSSQRFENSRKSNHERRSIKQPSERILYLHRYFLRRTRAVVSDEDGYVVFATELEAQKEIVDNQMTRLRQFLDGERDYEDAVTVEEYIVSVTVQPDGKIIDTGGNCFGPNVE